MDYAGRELESVAACNLCAGTRFVELSRRDRYGYAARALACLCCGLVSLSPRLTPAEYADFYATAYRPLVSVPRPLDRRRDGAGGATTLRRRLVQFLRLSLPAPPSRVLDVGGSTGVVAGAVREAFGAAATVLDPAPDELAHAAAAGMETVAGFAEDAEVGARTFELVLLCQTIDHLLDIAATLHSIRSWVAPGGFAFVDVLDVEFMSVRRGAIEGAIKIDHPYSLTRETALAYFRQAGLSPTAERLSDDGHLGFLLEPVEPAEPVWAELAEAGEKLRRRAWRLRARS